MPQEYDDWVEENKEFIIKRYEEEVMDNAVPSFSSKDDLADDDAKSFDSYPESVEFEQIPENFIMQLYEEDMDEEDTDELLDSGGLFNELIEDSDEKDEVIRNILEAGKAKTIKSSALTDKQIKILNYKKTLGYVGESWVKKDLVSKGYKVQRLVFVGSGGLLEKSLQHFLEGYEESEKLLSLLKENIVGLPDFICLKDGKITFAEVKTNNTNLSKDQQEVKSILERNGYPVRVRYLRIPNFRVEEIAFDSKTPTDISHINTSKSSAEKPVYSNRFNIWTEREDKMLVDNFTAKDISSEEQSAMSYALLKKRIKNISKMLGRTPNAIRMRLEKKGIPIKKPC